MSAHTPGPWTSYTGTHSIWAEGKRAICIMTGTRKTSDMERDANARLIAAAPDLLESLRELVELAVLQFGVPPAGADGPLPRALAVIAKAGGEPTGVAT